MPLFLEKKLKKEYGDNPHAIYGTMNKIGAMHGNKETAKGKAMERKHEHGHKKEEIAKKMGHKPMHHERHLKSQMNSIAGGKWGKKLMKDHEDKEWEYARENRMSDKRIF